MSKSFATSVLYVSLLFSTSPILAQDADLAKRLDASPRRHEFVDVDAPGNRKVHTWVVYPQGDKPATTVLVIHENRGLTDWVRNVADQLAEAGYVAVAPDLLSGTAPGGGNTPDYGS